jgi:chromosome partitioning protein
MKTIAFFNNKGGVGKTTLVYHMAWMFANLGLSVVAADLDPQANLTSMFLQEERLEQIWPDGEHTQSIVGALRPLIEGTGDIRHPHVEDISDRIGLVVGDLGLARVEDELSDQWPNCLDRKPRAFRVSSAFYRIVEQAAQQREAELVLIDVGPNLGAINRAAVIAADYIAVPLAPDLFSLQGLRNLGPSLRSWREEWNERLHKAPEDVVSLPSGSTKPIGYIAMQHALRRDRHVIAYQRWMDRIPAEYRHSVLGSPEEYLIKISDDPNCLAQLKHYRSLMPMAMEANKPMFFLKPADGAIGSHVQAVRSCYQDFQELAYRIADSCGIHLPREEYGKALSLF